jgi:hypothetical protein
VISLTIVSLISSFSLAVYAKGIHNMTKQILFCLLRCFEGCLLSLDSYPLGLKCNFIPWIKCNGKRNSGSGTGGVAQVTEALSSNLSTAKKKKGNRFLTSCDNYHIYHPNSYI